MRRRIDLIDLKLPFPLRTVQTIQGSVEVYARVRSGSKLLFTQIFP